MGYSAIEQAQIVIRDFLNYVFFNGLMINPFLNFYHIFMIKYIEIIAIAYTNIIPESDFLNGKENKINEFEYIDILIMLQIPYKENIRIFREYKIEKINAGKETKKNIVEAFINFFENFFEKESRNRWIEDIFSRFLFVFNSVELSKNEVNSIFNLIIDKNLINKINNCGLVELNKFILKKEPSVELLEKMIIKIPELENKYLMYDGAYLLLNIFEIYREKKGKEIIFEEEKLRKFYENNFGDSSENYYVFFFFSVLLNKKNKNLFLKKYINKIIENFSLEVYYNIAVSNIVVKNKELENKIISFMNKEFTEEKIIFLEKNPHICNRYIGLILNLLLDDKVNDEFKIELSNYKNEVFYGFIKNNGFENLWNYGIDKKNIDALEIEDIKNFNENYILKLLKKSEILTNKTIKYLKEHHKEEDRKNLLSAFLKSL